MTKDEIIIKRAKYIIHDLGKKRLITLLENLDFKRDSIYLDKFTEEAYNKELQSLQIEEPVKLLDSNHSNHSVHNTFSEQTEHIEHSITSVKNTVNTTIKNQKTIITTQFQDVSSQNQLEKSLNSNIIYKTFVKKLENIHLTLVKKDDLESAFAKHTCNNEFMRQEYRHALRDVEPMQIFKIDYQDDDIWYKNNDLEIAFHGTNFMNAFSILVTGLTSKVNNLGRKEYLYGKAIYLAKDIRVARDFTSSKLFRNQTNVSIIFIVEYKNSACREFSDYIMMNSGSDCRIRGILWFETSRNWKILDKKMGFFSLVAKLFIIILAIYLILLLY